VEHPENKVSPLVGLIPADMAMAVPGMPGVKLSWFTAGFACGLSPEGSILASPTTCAKK
jgi:hypothetical protein